ncbi:MAG TPA: hypothetical protein VF772_13025 [Terriglobales bacterium]
MGGSYGGKVTLAGVAFSPDAFTCGVDIVDRRTRTLFSRQFLHAGQRFFRPSINVWAPRKRCSMRSRRCSRRTRSPRRC